MSYVHPGKKRIKLLTPGTFNIQKAERGRKHHGNSRDTEYKRERKRRLEELLGELDISHLAKARAYSLSGGERRRVEITRALVTSPMYILLDEPFAGIDPLAVADIQRIIFKLKSKGIGVVISDHNVRETLSVCDRAYIVNEGTVMVEGDPETIANCEIARKIYLGEDFYL
jgi:lipopolysaccharide export system ATP-binding protein